MTEAQKEHAHAHDAPPKKPEPEISYESRRNANLIAQARRCFVTHQISKRSEGRWLLQKRYPDDKGWDWTMAAEVISLAGGGLFVGGDLHCVIFGWYSPGDDHEGKVRWMGECRDFGYYVMQKATIGTGWQLVEHYDEDAARETVAGWLSDIKEDDDIERVNVIEKLERLVDDETVGWDTQQSLIDDICERMGYEFMDDRFDLGIVAAARVHYAYAALGRLCELLDAEHHQGERGVQDERSA